MDSKKRVKMKKSSASKELLVDWLRTALDYQLYPGLGWSDRNEEIFYVKWVHKSSESWSGDDLAPFRAWAAHKGKLDGKNPKQLKATFRCALNSKKELKEHHRDRERRYWQFVDPNSVEKDKMPKKRRKNKNSSSRVDGAITAAYNKDVKRTSDNSLLLNEKRSRHENEMLSPAKLPAFNSFNFQPLTPPDQANEISCIRPDIKYSKENSIKLENCDTHLRDINHAPASISPFNVNNNFIESASDEYKPNYTPPPDQNRLTPPQKPYNVSRDSFNHSSTEVWQPNCFPVHNEDKEPKVLSEFFSSDFIGLYKSSTQESENNNCMDFLDMDQYVPVTDTSISLQIHNKNGQSTQFNRTPSSNQMQTDQLLEKFDDFFLDVDLEVCRKLVQEMDRTYRLQM